MKTIGIYGDSFCDDYEGWPSFLKLIMKNVEVYTHSFSSSSVEFSYKNFLETNHNYDIVIFLWTSMNRSSLIIHKDGEYNTEANVFISSYGDDNIIDYVLNFNKKNFNSDIKKYSSWIKSEYNTLTQFITKNKIFHQAMRDSVKLIRPDVINIECFSGAIYEYAFNTIYGIQNIVDQQFELIGFDSMYVNRNQTFPIEDPRKIKNHLSLRQNLEFAKYLHQHIENKDFDIHQTFINPKNFYTMAKSLEESGYTMEVN
jgi:hypothetical protein